jgi:hypothetical protein
MQCGGFSTPPSLEIKQIERQEGKAYLGKVAFAKAPDFHDKQ